MKVRHVIGLALIVIGIVLVVTGVYSITYHYNPYLKMPTGPFLRPGVSPDVYPYTLSGLVLITLGLIMLITGVLLLLIKPEK